MVSKEFLISRGAGGSDSDDSEKELQQEGSAIDRQRTSSEAESCESAEFTAASSEKSSSSKVLMDEGNALRTSLPSTWYTSENFFGLEARAIFSQVHPLH